MISRLLHRNHYLIFLSVFLFPTINAQIIVQSENEFYGIRDYYDRAWGPDYNLLNGRQYDLLYSGISHPYLGSDRYRPGSIRLGGEDYDTVRINYDIVNQQVILEYPGLSDRTRKIVLNNELIDFFQLDGNTFRKMSFPATGTSFFQVVSSGEISCYLLWEKKLYQTTSSSNTPFKYSKQSRKIYIHKEGQIYLVRNRSSFASIFDEAYRKEIKRYLRREQIRFRKSFDESLGDLMHYCNNLSSNG